MQEPRNEKEFEELAEDVPKDLLDRFVSGQCDADCSRPVIENGTHIICRQHRDCTNLGCRCRLYRIPKNPGADDQWEILPEGRQSYDSSYLYRCWCVNV